MTFFEHAMLGASFPLAAGLHRRYGWRIAVLAGLAAMLPDWDGLTLLLGSAAYDLSHRIWGHNVLAAVTVGGLVGVIEHRLALGSRAWWILSERFASPAGPPATVSQIPPTRRVLDSVVWPAVGIVASLSHLATDLVYSGHPHMQNWPLELFWPFSRRGWAYPIVPWGDLGATVIFVVEMFALYRWPRFAQPIAWLSLAGVCLYVAIRAVIE